MRTWIKGLNTSAAGVSLGTYTGGPRFPRSRQDRAGLPPGDEQAQGDPMLLSQWDRRAEVRPAVPEESI